MGRQSGDGGRLSAWAAREMRADTKSFPIIMRYEQPCAESGALRAVTATIDRDTVRIEAGGAARRIDLKSFRGVSLAVAQSRRDAGQAAAMVVLRHEEDALSLPLHVAHDSAGIVSEWQDWADALGCAALVDGVEGDCRDEHPLPDMADSGIPAPRRAGAYMASRRPAFLRGRAPGEPVAARRYVPLEIIARN